MNVGTCQSIVNYIHKCIVCAGNSKVISNRDVYGDDHSISRIDSQDADKNNNGIDNNNGIKYACHLAYY